MKLRPAEQSVVRLLAQGWTLKSHRNLDGDKDYVLHPLDDGFAQEVTAATVRALLEAGLVDSNKKFPAATYLLTERGKALAAGDDEQGPLTARGWL